MTLTFVHAAGLPPLSWCAVTDAAADTTTVMHGSWVETRDDWFVEGVWAGDFGGARRDGQGALMGFLGRADGHGVTFSCPEHPLEKLHVIVRGGKAFVSPSIPFVLAMSGTDLDASYLDFREDFLGFVSRLDRNEGSVPLRLGGRMLVFANRDVTIDGALRIRASRRENRCRFSTFGEYRDTLVTAMRAFVSNANAEERRVRFSPLASLSSGYDSNACAVIAQEAGCVDAVTLRSSAEDLKAYDGDDSGTHVGRILGMRVVEFERAAYLREQGRMEPLFLASGYLGEDIVLSGMSTLVPRRIFVSGLHGDADWSRDAEDFDTPDVRHPSGSGCSLYEYRVRVGFFHVPLPFVTALARPDTLRISRSEEMRAWSLGNDYDRPIARRLLEERGVPRDAFGQRKRGLFTTYFTGSRTGLSRSMSAEAFASFERFYALHGREPKASRTLARLAGYAAFKAAGRLDRRLRRRGSHPRLADRFPQRYRFPPLRQALLFPWAASVVRQDYESAADAAGLGRPSPAGG